MIRLLIATFGILTLSTSICNARPHHIVHRVKKETRTHHTAHKRGLQRGIASCYGRGFNGKKTASGEKLNPHKLTVAHRYLPFGTVVKITNNDNGLSVYAKVNDRGPFVKNRIVDLSQATAKAIHMSGLANVTLENIGHQEVEVAKYEPRQKIRKHVR